MNINSTFPAIFFLSFILCISHKRFLRGHCRAMTFPQNLSLSTINALFEAKNSSKICDFITETFYTDFVNHWHNKYFYSISHKLLLCFLVIAILTFNPFYISFVSDPRLTISFNRFCFHYHCPFHWSLCILGCVFSQSFYFQSFPHICLCW